MAAAGSSQSDAAAITTNVSRVTGANGTVGVKLTALSTFDPGQTATIINSDTSGTLKYYSNAAGETIYGQSGTTAVSLAAKTAAVCRKYDTSHWYCNHMAAPF